MVRRHSKQFFPDALVFPGDTVDASDHAADWLPLLRCPGIDALERAVAIAAFRETFEETGIFLAKDASGRDLPPPVVKDCPDFRALVGGSGGALPLDELVHFGRWITPHQSPKRYDTHFFLLRAPDGQIPTHDGSETVALEWIGPVDALTRSRTGERPLLFPTLMNLKRLAESRDIACAFSDARKRPRFTVQPHTERLKDGVLVTIPEEADYGQTEFFTSAL
jgi:8-oxo-dGTP pyrophosphatase MutT (NUDIX family)